MRRALAASLICLAPIAARAAAGPVEFDFAVQGNAGTAAPYSREIWGDVLLPGGAELLLPAYYAGDGVYAVRARPDHAGSYRLGAVLESTRGGARSAVPFRPLGPAERSVGEALALPPVKLDPGSPRRFVRGDGTPIEPVGANLAWDPREKPDPAEYYSRALPAFAAADLNWMRVWMAHWDGLDLSWLPPRMGASPAPGLIDPRVAQSWDRIVATATRSGVYLQVVLQHHGQYTTKNDSDWAQNPWNAANPGGFLKSPEDFFTDRRAREFTFLKYRYVVARWGWSPAIFAWELFNEVHWTDAVRNGRVADVARWHADAAAFLRGVDRYHHLVTTSTDNVSSPINGASDYLQPHLYSVDLVAGARAFHPPADTLGKPVFYGEEGDDHQGISAEEKKAATGAVPPIWASIMGEGSHPAQPWDGWTFFDRDRLSEIGAVHRFLEGTGMGLEEGLHPFSGAVDCTVRVPLRIGACQYWQRGPGPDLAIPMDGSEPIGEADVPYILVGTDTPRSDGFPEGASYRLSLDRAQAIRVRVDEAGAPGGALEVSLDGSPVAARAWAQGRIAADTGVVEVRVPAGSHTLSLRSSGRGWIGVPEIDLGRDTSDLASIGRRNDRFIAAWVFSRTNLYRVSPGAAVGGVLDLGETPGGSWTVTWWDTTSGRPAESHPLFHPGGILMIPVPPIIRHAAVVLIRNVSR